MKRANLHEIDSRIQSIVDNRVDPETGEIFEDGIEYAELLDELTMDRTTKILHCAMYMQEHNLEAEKIKSVIHKLKKRMDQHKSHAEFLKHWVETVCKSDEIFESPEIKVSFRTSTKLEIRNYEDLPDELIHTEVKHRLDKALAKKWMQKYGDVPPGIDEINCINIQVK